MSVDADTSRDVYADADNIRVRCLRGERKSC